MIPINPIREPFNASSAARRHRQDSADLLREEVPHLPAAAAPSDSADDDFVEGVAICVSNVLEEGKQCCDIMIGLKWTMLTYGKVREDLAAGVLLTVFRSTLRSDECCSAKKSAHIASSVNRNLHSFSALFLDIGRDQRTADAAPSKLLQALCLAISEAGKGHLLRKKAHLILDYLYCEIAPDRFAAGKSCAIGASGIIHFDDFITTLAADRISTDVPYFLHTTPPTLVDGWKCLQPYAQMVRENR